MKKYIPIIFLGSIFFIFLIGRVENSYDRIHPQFFFLGLIDLFSICYIFFKFSYNKIFNVIKENKLFILYSAYIFISLISILFSANKIESIIVFSQYFTFFITYLIILLISSLYNINYIKILVYFSAIAVTIESIAVLYSVFDFIVVEGKPFSRNNDYRGFSGNINITAFSLVVKSSFLYYLLFNKKNHIFHNVLYSIILTLVLTSLFFLLSRGAILAFIILNFIIVLYLIYSRKIIPNFGNKILVLFIMFLSSYFFTSSIIKNDNPTNLIADRVSSISLDTNDQSIGQRLRYYMLSTEIIKNNPITGIGIGNWKFKSIEYDAKNIEEYRVPYHNHNDFLQVASEIGIIGFVCFISIFIIPIIGSIQNILKSDRKLIYAIILGSLIVYSIDSMLNFPISRPISHVYFLFILVGYNSLNKLK